MTSTPTDMSPAAAAWVNIGPLVRASRPSTTAGRAPARPRGCPAAEVRTQAPSAAACRATSSGVRSVPTCPRIPETLIIRVSDIRTRIVGGRQREIGSAETSLKARWKASTTSGSNWRPAQRRSSSTASAGVRDGR